MHREEFEKYLKRGGRSPNAIKAITTYVDQLEEYLRKERSSNSLDNADTENLDEFVAYVEQKPKASAKKHLWGIRYYYQFIDNSEMASYAGLLRQARIKRTPFKLKDFRGVEPDYINALERSGITNTDQMLTAGKNSATRRDLAEKTGIPLEAVLELVKLSDLARIPGIKGIRARLYYDSGVDTIKKMAACEPEELLSITQEFVDRTGFDGIAPLPAEVRYSINMARHLPKIVKYD